MIRNILFDVDGTLYSSEGIIHEVYRDEFARWKEEFGKPDSVPSLEAIVAQIGRPVPQIFAALAPELSVEEREGLALRILERLVERVGRGEGEHYLGAADMVRLCYKRGMRLFTVSNGRYAYIEAVLRAGGVRACFEAVPHLAGMGALDKDELAVRVLEAYQLRAEETLLVGDRASDRDAARKIGVKFIACSYGHGHSEEWEGAHWIADRPSEVLSGIESLGGVPE